MWVKALTSWYNANKRTMPWREAPSAYKTWISEIMLQQTQVVTAIPYFNRFITQFPTVYQLAKADLQDVLKAWEGLGYYSRARHLHKAAKCIVETHHGEVPKGYNTLQTLPGIGPYCAAAIASIAFEEPVPVVDGNVLRVFTRFWGIFDDIRQPKVRTVLFDKLTPFIHESTPSIFNQALMECGALICTPKSPKCPHCPLEPNCFAAMHKKQNELPVKSKAAPVPHHTIVVGLIKRNNTVLIGKRKETQMLGGLWEFPGGKVKKSESLTEALSREIKEEVNLEVQIDTKIGTIKHAYSHFKISLHAYWCNYQKGTPKALSAEVLKWVSLDTLDDYPFPSANKKLFALIKNHEKLLRS